MNQTIDFSLVGTVHGTMVYGNSVQFWCESLDGDSTDTRIITLTFASAEIAEAVGNAAAWKP